MLIRKNNMYIQNYIQLSPKLRDELISR